MKILIIGNGFIANSITHKLASDNHELLVFSRTARAHIGCEQIQGDIFNFDQFRSVLDWKPEIIIHTAWITTPGIYRNDPTNNDYAEFTVKLAMAIKRSAVKHLIVLGTCAEYGHQHTPSVAGKTRLSPNILYSEKKVEAFNATAALLWNADVRFTWARIFYPYGQNQDPKRLIPFLVSSLRRNEPVVLADTSSIYDWITTRDIALAISWIIENEVPSEIDIGTSIGYTNLQILGEIEKLLQIENVVPSREAHNFGLNEVFVVGKNSPLLKSGWSPADTLKTGLEWALKL